MAETVNVEIMKREYRKILLIVVLRVCIRSIALDSNH